jgi:Cof subfamily protein (haloacid dehalogenase superfamily)
VDQHRRFDTLSAREIVGVEGSIVSYRLLCFDYDGTAADGGHFPTPRVREAVAAAQVRGVRVVLATGRSFGSAYRYAETLGLQDAVIASQGAIVKEMASPHETLVREVMPLEPLHEFLALAEARDLDLSLYGEEEYYITALRRSSEFHRRWFGPPFHQVATYADALAALRAKGEAPIKGLMIGEPGEGESLAAELRAIFQGRLTVLRSHELFTEVTPPSASKGNALAFLAERYGIPQAETIAVGDSDNDISMIRWAGLGVAMGNAAPEVIAVADCVAPSVYDDGLAAVIEEYVLRNGRG